MIRVRKYVIGILCGLFLLVRSLVLLQAQNLSVSAPSLIVHGLVLVCVVCLLVGREIPVAGAMILCSICAVELLARIFREELIIGLNVPLSLTLLIYMVVLARKPVRCKGDRDDY